MFHSLITGGHASLSLAHHVRNSARLGRSPSWIRSMWGGLNNHKVQLLHSIQVHEVSNTNLQVDMHIPLLEVFAQVDHVDSVLQEWVCVASEILAANLQQNKRFASGYLSMLTMVERRDNARLQKKHVRSMFRYFTLAFRSEASPRDRRASNAKRARCSSAVAGSLNL